MKFNNPSYSEEEKSTPIQRKYFNNKYTAGALHTGSKQRSCIYCGENHWNDECPVYPDIESRKKKLIGHCYICLRRGHMVHECNVNKECIDCKKKRSHHRSLECIDCKKKRSHHRSLECIDCKKKRSHHRSLCGVQFPKKFERKSSLLEVLEGSGAGVIIGGIRRIGGGGDYWRY